MISTTKHRYLKNYQDLKVGDVLTVRSESWYREYCNSKGLVDPILGQDVFTHDMLRMAGKKVHVSELVGNTFGFKEIIHIQEDEDWHWHTWMFEEFEFPPKD